MRRRAKVDANQTEIVAALRAAGCYVQSLATIGSGCPDLLVGLQNKSVLFEIKSHEKALLEPAQMKWASLWNGCPLFVVYTAEQAIEVMTQIAPIPYIGTQVSPSLPGLPVTDA